MTEAGLSDTSEMALKNEPTGHFAGSHLRLDMEVR